jgi:hypothetical protein
MEGMLNIRKYHGTIISQPNIVNGTRVGVTYTTLCTAYIPLLVLIIMQQVEET